MRRSSSSARDILCYRFSFVFHVSLLSHGVSTKSSISVCKYLPAGVRNRRFPGEKPFSIDDFALPCPLTHLHANSKCNFRRKKNPPNALDLWEKIYQTTNAVYSSFLMFAPSWKIYLTLSYFSSLTLAYTN